MQTGEQWRPIPDLAGYEASDQGRIRSLRKGPPRVLRGTVGPCGFVTVAVSVLAGPGGCCRRIGELVAEAWIGPRAVEREVRHVDGDPLNDRQENLSYGTRDEVAADHEARARREEAAGAPTHCPEGHRYADNWLGSWGNRLCPTCQRQAAAERRRENRLDYHRRWHKANYQPRKPLTTPCVVCGTDVQQNVGRPGGLILACPPCRLIREQDAQRRYREKARGNRVRISFCIDCGTKITNQGLGALALRCAPHKMLAQRETSRRYEQRRRRGAA